MYTVESQPKCNHGLEAHLDLVPDLVVAPAARIGDLELFLGNFTKVADEGADDFGIYFTKVNYLVLSCRAGGISTGIDEIGRLLVVAGVADQVGAEDEVVKAREGVVKGNDDSLLVSKGFALSLFVSARGVPLR